VPQESWSLPHGGVRLSHQKSTCLTQLTLGANVLQIGSRYLQNLNHRNPRTTQGQNNAYLNILSFIKVPCDLPLSGVWSRSVGYPTLLDQRAAWLVQISQSYIWRTHFFYMWCTHFTILEWLFSSLECKSGSSVECDAFINSQLAFTQSTSGPQVM